MSIAPIFTREQLQQAGMVVPSVRFEDEIAAFARADVQDPPRTGGLLFVGDSDIRFWNDGDRFAADFAGLDAVNRGFGGARTWETLLFFHVLALPHRPRTVVYNAGDNDIAALRGEGPATAARGFRLFADAVGEHLPDTTRVLFLSIHPSPCNEELWDIQRQANEEIHAFCQGSDLAEYVDYLHLLQPNGVLRSDAFRPDRLHFTEDFYREWAAFLRPLLERKE